ncbi:MAG: hypothetical protein U7123_26735 [Potamolinea sp.]
MWSPYDKQRHELDKSSEGLFSDWQVKAENIPRWSQQCLGRELTPTQFQESPVTARGILVCVMRDVLREQYTASNNKESVAVQRAASWWMTGDPNQYNSGSTCFLHGKSFRFVSSIAGEILLSYLISSNLGPHTGSVGLQKPSLPTQAF